MGRKRILVTVIAAVLLLCVVGLAVQGVRVSRAEASTKATATALESQLIAPLRAICSGQATTVAGAGAFAPGPGLHPVVAFRTTNVAANFFRDTRVGTGDWSPATLPAAQLVACAEDTWVTVESCPYKSQATGSTSYLDRSQNQVKLRLVAAQSGQVVATQTLSGGAPRACQDQESFPSGLARLSVAGEAVSPATIQGWLKPHVAP